MPKPLKAICPHCDASFKLKDRKAVGKKVNCPTCSEPFTIKLKAAPVDDDVEFEDDLDDELDDDYDDDLDDDFEDDYDRPRKSSSRNKRPSKSRKQKGKTGQVIVFAVAGVLGIGFLVAAGFFISSMMKGGDELDTDYLPANSEVVFHMKVRELARSELMGDAFEAGGGGGFGGGFGGMGGGGQDFSPEDVKSVTFGVSGIGKLDPNALQGGPMAAMNILQDIRWVMVVKSYKSLRDDLAGNPMMSGTDHGGETYYKTAFLANMAIWQASSKVVVVGSEDAIKAAIDKGTGASLSRYNFVDGGRDIVLAIRPDDDNLGKFRDQDEDVLAQLEAIPGVPDSVKRVAKDLKEGMVGMAVGINVDSDVHILLQMQMDEATRAESVQADLESFVEWGRDSLEQFRSQMPAEMADIAQAVLDGIEVDRSSTAVSLATTVPGNMQDRLRNLDPSDFIGLGGGGNTFPRPNPGGGGGGFNPPPANVAAQRTSDGNNLKQIGIAIHNYHDLYGELPTGIRDDNGRKLLSWRVQLLPFLEQQPLYEQFHHDEPWNSAHNMTLMSQMPDVLRSPCVSELSQPANSDKTSYMTFSNGTPLGDGPRKFADLVAGSSNTIAVVQGGSGNMVPWTKPEDTHVIHAIHVPTRADWTDHKGFNVLMADGAVKWMTVADSGRFQQMLKVDQTGGGGGSTVAPSTPKSNLGFSSGSGFSVPSPKVVYSITAFNGTGKQSDVAKNAIASAAIAWADTTKFAYDTFNGEIHVALLPGALQKGVDTGAAKTALENAGFTVTGSKLDNSRQSTPRDPGVVRKGQRVVVNVPATGDDANANEVLRRQTRAGMQNLKWIAPGTVRVDAGEGRIEFLVGGDIGTTFELKRGLEGTGLTVDSITLAATMKGQEIVFNLPGIDTNPDGPATVEGVLSNYGFIDEEATAIENGDLTVLVVYETDSSFKPLDAMNTIKAALQQKGLTVGATRLGAEKPAVRRLSLGGTLVPSDSVPPKKGRPKPAAMLRITMLDGPSAAATGYGNVVITKAVDQAGRPLTPYDVAEELDYTTKIIDITPDNKFNGGVHVFVIFESPRSSVLTTATIQGTFQLRLASGDLVDVPFDLQNVAPGP